MLLLDPVNSITSIQFYRKASAFGAGRSLLFLAYVSSVFMIAACAATKLKIFPAVDSTFHWLETSMPVLTVQNGKVTSNLKAPMTVRHPDPELKDLVLVIDTTRTAPVTPKEMEEAGTHAYLTNDAFYMMDRMGTVRPHELKMAASGKPIVIDASFYRTASGVMKKLLLPVTAAIAFIFFFGWKSVATLGYSLLALALKAALKVELPYSALLNIALYAQSLVIALQIVFLFMPRGIPAFGLLGPLATGIYIWLGIKAHLQTEGQPHTP